jgi:ankyrin repeat protein
VELAGPVLVREPNAWWDARVELQDPVELAEAQRVFDLAREGLTGELKANVESGLPVDLVNDAGDTLLLLAAYYAHPHTVAALVRAGADLDRANERGQTPLAAAAFRGDLASVTTLLEAGADPHAGDPDALEAARFFGNPDVLALLTDALRRSS